MKGAANHMRICSLVPSATEILFALGLGDSVAGVTHECDFPAEAAKKPAVVRPRLDPQAHPAEIDRQVSAMVARGESLYVVDAELLGQLSPDLIVTQDLCHVCAASSDDLATALTRLPKYPQVLALTPHSLVDVWNDIRRVGDAAGYREQGEALALALADKVTQISRRASAAARKPRVLCLEWLDPYFVGGHWVPEMVAMAGGEDALGREAEVSFRVSAEQVGESRPDVIIVMPCGYDASRAATEFQSVRSKPLWTKLSAGQNCRAFAVDASAYFSRPGPRLADGVALLAHLLHPELFAEAFPSRSFRELS